MKSHKLSVITVCYNAEHTIEKTITSILGQTFSDFEYIIIDGKSTDSTIEIIEKYDEKFKAKRINYHWFCAYDNGIYDAMNKGLELANGEWIIFMNADDCFFNQDVLSIIFSRNYNNNIGIVYGDVVYDYHTVEVIKKYKIKNSRFFINDTICHQTMFVRSEVYELSNGFSNSFKIVADKEIILKTLFNFKKTIKHVPISVVKYSIDGFSSKYRELSLRENGILVSDYYPKSIIFFNNIKYNSVNQFKKICSIILRKLRIR